MTTFVFHGYALMALVLLYVIAYNVKKLTTVIVHIWKSYLTAMQEVTKLRREQL